MLLLLPLLAGCVRSHLIDVSNVEQIRGTRLDTLDGEVVTLPTKEAPSEIRAAFVERQGHVMALDDRPKCWRAIMVPEERQDALEEAGWSFPDDLRFGRDDVHVKAPRMWVRDRRLGCVGLQMADVRHLEVFEKRPCGPRRVVHADVLAETGFILMILALPIFVPLLMPQC
jgi:hypothetical protein